MKKQKLLLSVFIYVFWVILFASYSYFDHKKDIIHAIDKQLELSANNFVNALPSGLHHKNLSEDYLSDSEDLALLKISNDFAELNDIYYIYSMVKQENKIVFIAANATEEDIKENQSAENRHGSFYFYPYDDASENVHQAFLTEKAQFYNVKDQWGSFRSVFIPFKADDGSVFVIGADVTLEHVQSLLAQELFETLLISLIFVLAVIPFFYSYTSESRAWNKLIERQKKTVEDAHQAKIKFLDGMSHDLHQPISDIVDYSEQVENDVTLSEDSQKKMNQIKLSAGRLLKLIDNVLDLSAIETNRFKLMMESSNLALLLEESIAMALSAHNQHSVEVFNNIKPSDNRKVYVDRERFIQIVFNLISNAMQHNVKNGMVVLKSRLLDDSQLCIEVIDTGNGLHEVQQENFFKAFDKTISYAVGDNTGIDLYVVKAIVEQMGGKVGVESTLGQGTTVWFSVPLAE